jgi:hypothetical protein
MRTKVRTRDERREEQLEPAANAGREGFTATLTHCCAKNAEFAAACVT